MRMNMFALKLASLILLSLIICRTAPAQQPPDNIEGNWTIYSNRIQDGAIEIKHVQIQQIGNRLEGISRSLPARSDTRLREHTSPWNFTR